MEKDKTCRDIYFEMRSMNRHLQRVGNIGMLALLLKLSEGLEDDKNGKRLLKAAACRGCGSAAVSGGSNGLYKKEEWRSRRLSANGKISIGSCESADNPIGQMGTDSENMERKMQRNL